MVYFFFFEWYLIIIFTRLINTVQNLRRLLREVPYTDIKFKSSRVELPLDIERLRILRPNFLFLCVHDAAMGSWSPLVPTGYVYRPDISGVVFLMKQSQMGLTSRINIIPKARDHREKPWFEPPQALEDPDKYDSISNSQLIEIFHRWWYSCPRLRTKNRCTSTLLCEPAVHRHDRYAPALIVADFRLQLPWVVTDLKLVTRATLYTRADLNFLPSRPRDSENCLRISIRLFYLT
jgi:hypothetical protein